MTDALPDREGLQSCLDEAIQAHSVPGAAVAIQVGEETTIVTSGSANLRTGFPVTDHTLFLIGSISKVYTATLMMQLVERSLVDLDAAVRAYLPELRLADPEALDDMTVRQLISHTSGIDENLGLDFGRDDDCIERFVARGSELPQLHPPGLLFSYCNSGFIIAGRIIEKITGRAFDRAVADFLCEPLELRETVMLADDAILHPVAVGHLPQADGRVEVAPTWALPRAVGPAGGICASVRDVATFAQAHLGVTPNGRTLLSEAGHAAMREAQVDFADQSRGTAQGLGWRIWEERGTTIIGHFGGNIGQYCNVMVVPSRSFAMVVLTNSFAGAPTFEAIRDRVFGDVLRLQQPPATDEGELPTDLEPFIGTYESFHDTMHVELRDGSLWLSSTPTPNWINKLYSAEKTAGPLTPIAPTIFKTSGASLYGEEESRVVFIYPDGDGRPEYLHQGDYAYRRAS